MRAPFALLFLLFSFLILPFSLRGSGVYRHFNVLKASKEMSEEEISRLGEILERTKGGNLFTMPISADTAASWSLQLIPKLERIGAYELYFELNRILISFLAERGDISVALDRVSELQQKAKECKSEVGMGIAGMSIANTYMQTGMYREAYDAYQEALELLSTIPETDNYQRIVIYQLHTLALALERHEEARKYLGMMGEARFYEGFWDHDYSVDMSTAFYYICLGKADSATYMMELIGRKYTGKRYDYLKEYNHHLSARYFELLGDYQKSLNHYDRAIASSEQNFSSYKHMNLCQSKAKLYEKMNRPLEACYIYRDIRAVADSSAHTSYSRQINSLRAKYQIDRIDLEGRKEMNRLLTQGIVLTFILAAIILIAIFYIRRKNRRLVRVKKELLAVKKNAEESIRSKSIFLSNMSHEIRTPLNAIVGFSSLLSMEDVDDETRKQSNEIIKMNSELLLKLINDVIDLSRLDLGELNFNIESCDVIYLCEGVIDTMNKIKQTPAEIRLESAVRSLHIETDTARLQQMLINLLVNATKFTPSGHIILSVEQLTEDTVRFAVTDTGSGIPKEKQKQIFERFAKLNEHAQGSGIGLSICQLIIKKLGGEIGIDPEYRDGARFLFTHPVRQGASRPRTDVSQKELLYSQN